MLKQHIVAIENSLGSIMPEEYPQLKKALLQVSKMISQMESVVDVLSLKRLNLKNEIRTYADENAHLQGALMRERRKTLGSDRADSTGRAGAKSAPPPPPPPKRDTSIALNSVRPFLFPPPLPRYYSLKDSEPSMADLTLDGPGASASTTRVTGNLTCSTGPFGSARKSRGIARAGRSSSNLSGVRRSASARRGRGSAGRSKPRPSPTSGNSGSSSPVPSAPVMIGFGSPTTSFSPPPPPPTAPLVTPDPQRPGTASERNDVNENSLLNRRFNNRNNKLAGKRLITIFDSYPSVD